MAEKIDHWLSVSGGLSIGDGVVDNFSPLGSIGGGVERLNFWGSSPSSDVKEIFVSIELLAKVMKEMEREHSL